MSRVIAAFLRAIASQLHPKMLALLLVPFAVAVVFWTLVALFAWDPLVDWLRTAFFEGGGVVHWLWTQAGPYLPAGFQGLATAAVALMLLLPLMFVTALVLIAVLSMPAVNLYLGRGAYRDVERRGAWSVLASLWNALAGTLLFLAGYLATLPLWLVPPLGFVIPWLWWGWLTAKVMRFDSLVEHADADERRALISAHRGRYLALGLLVTVLNYVPPLFLVTPVLSALAFGHFSLTLLREWRAGQDPSSGGPADDGPGPDAGEPRRLPHG